MSNIIHISDAKVRSMENSKAGIIERQSYISLDMENSETRNKYPKQLKYPELG